MTATDELRRMLDERGVEWEENQRVGVKWTADGRRYVASETLCDDYGLLAVFGLTPEQAIEATLGRGECRECADMDDVFECSACGARYESWALKRFASYCPDCGRKVRA